MFKTILVGLTLFVLSLSAFAELTPSTSVEEAKKAAEQKCAKGCLVLSPEEIAAIEQGIQAAVINSSSIAFKQGLASCRNQI